MSFEGVEGGVAVLHVPATYDRVRQPLRPYPPIPNKIKSIRIVGGWEDHIGEDNWELLKDYISRIGASLVEVDTQGGFDTGQYGVTNM